MCFSYKKVNFFICLVDQWMLVLVISTEMVDFIVHNNHINLELFRLICLVVIHGEELYLLVIHEDKRRVHVKKEDFKRLQVYPKRQFLREGKSSKVDVDSKRIFPGTLFVKNVNLRFASERL